MEKRRIKDGISAVLMRVAVLGTNALAVAIFLGLYLKSHPILAKKPLVDLLFSSEWFPLKGQFGFYPFIVGTVEVTLLAMLLAVPLCLLSAIYLSEYAGMRVRGALRPAIDLLAGVPSVIYGLFGVLVIVPLVGALGASLGKPSTGYSLLSGGIILAVMVFPVIISVSTEVLLAVPSHAREVSMGLGATRWETARHVVVRSAKRGIAAAVVLGFARAFGETIAVLMVVGNVAKVPTSIFDPAYPLPALIANNYGEMMSIPMYDSALMLSALVLLVVVAGFTLAAHLVLFGSGRNA
jgi:phosphate transport system permease protein